MSRILGVAAAVFAGMLLTLPTIRWMQGRLTLRMASGLWISGIGFALLALAALLLEGESARGAVVLGVLGTGIGMVVQKRNAGSRTK